MCTCRYRLWGWLVWIRSAQSAEKFTWPLTKRRNTAATPALREPTKQNSSRLKLVTRNVELTTAFGRNEVEDFSALATAMLLILAPFHFLRATFRATFLGSRRFLSSDLRMHWFNLKDFYIGNVNCMVRFLRGIVFYSCKVEASCPKKQRKPMV